MLTHNHEDPVVRAQREDALSVGRPLANVGGEASKVPGCINQELRRGVSGARKMSNTVDFALSWRRVVQDSAVASHRVAAVGSLELIWKTRIL
jgi:hypothetical protein